ncbi:sulfatase-like hydrolase/transferase [Stieleria sedimenti]|uniref:sulfatase-like hydrolase/transferase n=1 Tax=Stieleria sedimenti TaxID=2976331 RepID=UPI00389996B6
MGEGVSLHGNPLLKTLNLNHLAKESVRFTDFHVAPMCSPTRGQLMTGIDAMKNGCTAVCQGRSMMRRELPTMANTFAGSGYATGRRTQCPHFLRSKHQRGLHRWRA